MAFQKLGWSLVLGLLLTSCSSNEGGSTDEPAEVSGAQLYQENCVICHGDDGKAGISGATDLSMSSLSEDSIKHYILQGKKSMPPFSFSGHPSAQVFLGLSAKILPSKTRRFGFSVIALK